MLVLTRRLDEEVVISDAAGVLGVVRVVDVGGGKVRLGFTFPKHVRVDRREIAEQQGYEPAREAGAEP